MSDFPSFGLDVLADAEHFVHVTRQSHFWQLSQHECLHVETGVLGKQTPSNRLLRNGEKKERKGKEEEGKGEGKEEGGKGKEVKEGKRIE